MLHNDLPRSQSAAVVLLLLMPPGLSAAEPAGGGAPPGVSQAGSTKVSSAAQPDIVGMWKMTSMVTEDESGAVTRPWGDKPDGRLVYTADGRMMALLTASDRRVPSAQGDARQAEYAALYLACGAYSGTYSFVDGSIVHLVDVAVDPSWVGSRQVRFAKMNGEVLELSTPFIANPDGKKYKYTISWVRLK